MITVSLYPDGCSKFPIDGARDLLRLFYGPAKFYELQANLYAYEAEAKQSFQWGCFAEQAFCITAAENEPLSGAALEALIQSPEFCSAGQVIALLAEDSPKLSARKLKRSFYNCLTKETGKEFPWGSLSGIRPSYIAQEYLSQNTSPEETCLRLKEDYHVSSKKAALVVEVALAEQKIIAAQPKNAVHLYVHVPFCITRCSYCSFTSMDAVNPSEERLQGYLKALLSEIRETLSGMTTKVNSIYFGGGTPSIFSTSELNELFSALSEFIDLNTCPEITFEAGRSDSLDEMKLKLLHDLGVTRLCINPQSMQADTLSRVNRPDSPEQVKITFKAARAAGFNHINMDLIAGLGGESEADFADSLQQIIALQPESVTIHSLAKKRNSDLDQLIKNQSKIDDECRQKDAALLKHALGDTSRSLENMLEYAELSLTAAGYHPYYLYRHKDGVGGLENVGYARKGFECAYNVCMMADAQSVLAFGAGAMSKRVSGQTSLRCPNVKSISEYTARINEMAQRKKELFSQEHAAE